MTALTDLPPFPDFAADVLDLDVSARRAGFAIMKAIDGQPLDADELELFQTHTGLETPREDGYPYSLVLVGRQAGKTELFGGARLVYEAVAASLSGDRGVACVGVSQGHREARNVLFRYVSRFLESPLLADLIVSQTADTITLRGDVTLAVAPCAGSALRGLRCRLVVLDEVAHFRGSDARPLDAAVWRAALATTLTTDGRVIAVSSPYAASGLCYALHRMYYAKPGDVLVWQSPSYVLHPTLSAAAMDSIRAVDPEGAEAEIEGRFLTSVSALLDGEALDAAVDRGVAVREPVASIEYHAFVDVSTGVKATGDRWAVAIAHNEDGVSVLDALMAVSPPFSPATAAKQTAQLCHSYSVREIEGDRFAQGFTGEAFADVGLDWKPARATASDIYIELAAALQSGTVRLLDDERLLREARMLERRRGSTKDRITHPNGTHDDAINAAAGALTAAAARPTHTGATWGRQEPTRSRQARLRAAVRSRVAWARRIGYGERSGPSAVDRAFPAAPAPRPREHWPDPPRHADADHGGTLGAPAVSTPPDDGDDPFSKANRYR